MTYALYAATETGDPALEQWRLMICNAVARNFEPGADLVGVAQACLAIVNNELPPGAARMHQFIVGDVGLRGGPSIGPMQVYRSTATEMGLFGPPPDATSDQDVRDAYTAIA